MCDRDGHIAPRRVDFSDESDESDSDMKEPEWEKEFKKNDFVAHVNFTYNPNFDGDSQLNPLICVGRVTGSPVETENGTLIPLQWYVEAKDGLYIRARLRNRGEERYENPSSLRHVSLTYDTSGKAYRLESVLDLGDFFEQPPAVSDSQELRIGNQLEVVASSGRVLVMPDSVECTAQTKRPCPGQNLTVRLSEGTVDCGQRNYVTNPTPGTWIFDADNPNKLYISWRTTKFKYSRKKNKRTATCQGSIECVTDGCPYQLPPKKDMSDIKAVEGTKCLNCHTPSMVHVPCTTKFTWTSLGSGPLSDDKVMLTVEGDHSQHRTPIPTADPPTINELSAWEIGDKQLTAKAARIGQALHLDAKRWNDPSGRRIRKAIDDRYRELFPGGVNFDGIEAWKETKAEPYIVAATTTHIHCQFEFQRQAVSMMMEECIRNPATDCSVVERDWELVFFSDLTYSVAHGWYKMNTNLYSHKLRRTLPAFVTFQTRLHMEAYESHFYHLLLYNPSMIDDVRKKLNFAGFLVDFSDAQRGAFLTACGHYLLARQGVLETEHGFWERARKMGEAHFAEFLHGCNFHWNQSVERVRRNGTLVPPNELEVFNRLTRNLLKECTIPTGCTRAVKRCQCQYMFDSTKRAILKKFPRLENWLTWWLKPQHASMIFPPFRGLSKEERQQIPTTDNCSEAINRDEKRFAEKEHLPVVAALDNSYKYVFCGYRDLANVEQGLVLRPRARKKQKNKRKTKRMAPEEWNWKPCPYGTKGQRKKKKAKTD